jgi:small redox-active disulfide protein 1
MKSPKLELFYSPFCPSCPKAKEIVRGIAEEYKVSLEEINILSPEGLKRGVDYDIRDVPCTVINGEYKVFGVPVRENILNYLFKE